MTTKKPYVPEEWNTNRVLRIILWFVGGAFVLAALCCVCTLAVGWYAGDFFVDMLRSIFR